MTSVAGEIQSRSKFLDCYMRRCKHHGFAIPALAEYDKLKGSILLALQDLASESKDKKSKSRFSSLVSLRRASSPTETKYDELNKTLRDLQDRLPHLDTIAKGVLTTVTYRPVSGDPNPIVARTGRQSISKDAPKLFAAESSDGALLVFKEVADSPFESLGAAAQEKWRAEERKWRSLQHDNILRILGTADFQGQFYMVSEFAANGNIVDYLNRNKDASVPKLLRDTAAALQYLHVQHGLVHGDIKPNNILISLDGRALLCDFSTVKMNGDDSSSGSKGKRSVIYLSPECLQDTTLKRSTEDDMWAFGMCIAQVVKRAASPWNGNISGYEALRDKIIRKNERPIPPPVFMHPVEKDVWDVAALCWRQEASQRIGIEDAVKMLNRLGG